MSHFTLGVSALGPVIKVVVAVSGPRREALVAAGQVVPPAQTIQALVDTGASCTCVDPAILTPLGLTPTGSIPMLTPSTGETPSIKEQYDVSLYIFGAADHHPPFQLPTIGVVATELRHQGFDALLGRDILGSCILIYNGGHGSFTLAF